MPGLQNPVVDADGGLAFDFPELFSPQLVLPLLERHTMCLQSPCGCAVPYRIDPSVPKQAAQCKRRLSFTAMPLIGSQPRRERSHIQRAATRDLLTCPSRAFGPSPETSSHLASPRRSSRSGGSRMQR